MKINVFFEGGGILGLCFIGAYQALSEYKLKIDKALGISVGSIVASLIISGYTHQELISILNSYDDFSFLKKETSVSHKKVVGKPLSLLVKKGIYDSKVIEDFITDLLSKKQISTFQDVTFGSISRLKMVAYDYSIKKMLVLPEDLRQYGYNPFRFKIPKAVRMSCAIPFFYTPVIIKRHNQYHYIIDGGVVKNIPTSLIMEKNKLTFRLKINTKRRNFLKNLLNFDNKSDNNIVIPIEQKLKSTDFHLNRKQIMYLFEQGYTTTYNYLQKRFS